MRTQFVGALLLFVASSLSAQMLRLTDLNTTQIEKLDRARTVILMPGGVIEQHGPYLPAFSDGFMNEWWTERVGEARGETGARNRCHPTRNRRCLGGRMRSRLGSRIRV